MEPYSGDRLVVSRSACSTGAWDAFVSLGWVCQPPSHCLFLLIRSMKVFKTGLPLWLPLFEGRMVHDTMNWG